MTTPAQEPEKRVSWAELFFDLVFVVAVTQVSELLLLDHSALGLLRALSVFVPIYWTWVGTTIQANVADVAGAKHRLGLFVIGLAGLFLALAAPDSYGSSAVLFAVVYWASRTMLTLIQGTLVTFRLTPPTISATVTGPMLLVGALLPVTLRLPLWLLAAAIDLSTLRFLRSRLRWMHFDAGHLAERFGLFVLIALGETVVAVAVSATDHGHLTFSTSLAVVAAFVACCGLWWVYFQYAADAMRYALATAEVQLDISRQVLSYGHLAFIGGIIGVAVGLHEAVAEPFAEMGWAPTSLLFGGTALYLAAFGYTRWRMFRKFSMTRMAAAGVVLVLLPVAELLPGLAALAILAVILVVLNLVEYRRVAAE